MTRIAKLRRRKALEKLLAGEPAYPVGTVVRELQDELAALRSHAPK